jgi:Amino acid permease
VELSLQCFHGHNHAHNHALLYRPSRGRSTVQYSVPHLVHQHGINSHGNGAVCHIIHSCLPRKHHSSGYDLQRALGILSRQRLSVLEMDLSGKSTLIQIDVSRTSDIVAKSSVQMNHHWHVPFNSVYVASVIGGIFCLINLGSTFGFNIIVSLSLLALLSTYMISIGCVLRKRTLKEELPPARWSLGRFGLPINAFAFFYSLFVLIFSCFPTQIPVALDSANWAPSVWSGVIVIAVVVYFLHGRRKYTPPVTFVEGRKVAGVGLQST